MIISCPSCATRYTMPGFGGAPVTMTCRACGCSWKEAGVIDAIPVVETVTARSVPSVIEHEEAPELEAQRLAELAREAQERFRDERAARLRKRRAWGIWAASLMTPFIAALAFPETVVASVPFSIKAYQAIGMDVNVYGLEVRRVERQHAIVNGTRVLSVKGEISNIASQTRKIPWLRFALMDASGKELYTWTLDTGARPLRSGETTSFVTRVAAPPEAAQNLKIRFARADEIVPNGQVAGQTVAQSAATPLPASQPDAQPAN